MNRKVIDICEAVRHAGGRAMLVGGSVRDKLSGTESKDYDIEVFRLEPATLRNILEGIAKVDTVGEHFAVYKLALSGEPASAPCLASGENRVEIDVSIPRRESKSGRGHRGFVIEGDPWMSFEEAARRRDFTINAILLDPLTDQIVDPFHGADDLRGHILRAVAADTFVDDSLRVLRGVQLAARFELRIEPQTVNLCRGIDLSDLPRERIWGEVEKLLMMASRPSIGLDAALELAVLDKLFPELQSLAARGEAFTSTKRALDEAATLTAGLSKPRHLAVMLATVCSRLTGEASASLLDRLGIQTLNGYDVRGAVLSLLREQAAPRRLYEDRERATDGDFRRLSVRVEIDLLHRLVRACSLAAEGSSVAADWFIEKARVLDVTHKPPAPVLRGRHLLEAGFEPGPQVGEMLRRVYELQLDGEVSTVEEGVAAARRLSKINSY